MNDPEEMFHIQSYSTSWTDCNMWRMLRVWAQRTGNLVYFHLTFGACVPCLLSAVFFVPVGKLPGRRLGGVRDRSDQQRGHVRGDPCQGWHRDGGGAEGGVEASRAHEDVREDVQVQDAGAGIHAAFLLLLECV